MDDRLFPVDVSTLQERVYQQLRSALHQGKFMPGEVVTIRSLASALGTSAMPVREALQRLVAERALVQLPNRNIRVAPFDLEIFADHTRTRGAIEGHATYRAAIRQSADLVEQLTTANAAMRSAIAAGDADGTLDANRAFHFALYSGAASPQLLEIITSLWLRSGPYINLALRRVPEAKTVFERGTRNHDRIIDAIVQGDPKMAQFCLALDIRLTAMWFRHWYRGQDAVSENFGPAA
jgi:DNA-binding GntR family transcriptional regulator